MLDNYSSVSIYSILNIPLSARTTVIKSDIRTHEIKRHKLETRLCHSCYFGHVRRYQLIPDAAIRESTSYSVATLPRTQSPYGPAPVRRHAKTLQAVATVAHKYLSLANKRNSSMSMHDEEMTYLRWKKKSFLFWLFGILLGIYGYT